jgi:O-antigen ligase
MVLSLFWTIESQLTQKAIVKELGLLGIPICFLFINFKEEIKSKIITIYSYAMVVYSIYYLISATIKFFTTNNAAVFFYHNLVSLDVNAVHVSIYFSISSIYFIKKKNKSFTDIFALVLLLVTIILLASKNVIITFFFLLLFYFLCSAKNIVKTKFVAIFTLVLLAVLVVFPNKIKDRFLIEIQSNSKEKTLASEFDNAVVYNVTIREAWKKEKFEPNDYFPGAALRVYQARIFFELLVEENIFFKGYGLNASWKKIKQKRMQHNLYKGYEKYNFHNQYIQNFAELGVFGLLLLLAMLSLSLKNAINNKDFMHFSFTILMISLFLTESFLWRQRGIVFFTTLYCLFNTNFVVQNIFKIKKNT